MPVFGASGLIWDFLFNLLHCLTVFNFVSKGSYYNSIYPNHYNYANMT